MSEHEGAGIIPRKIRRSAAWRAVTGDARKVLIALASRYDGSNNGELAFEGQDGIALGLSEIETKLALIELEKAGLVDSRPRRNARQ